eukprot:TRINITY_DN21735_c0_g1_i1.p1 TRINITY_DN21735_c0_g1~~TRINITY_DN21735_c0_g1_i1.p1  ORF type:complete len:233 (+),score=38.21 TRINITY_DN21735_c0_g1_i1:103-699(+)
MASIASVRPCFIVCSLNAKERSFNPLSLKNVAGAAPRRWRCLSGSSSLTGGQCRVQKPFAALQPEVISPAGLKEEENCLASEADAQSGFRVIPSMVAASSSALLLQASLFAAPALAELPAYTDEEFIQIILVGGAFGIFYLLVAPLIIYQYCRVRWLKKSTPETVFMYALVFLFFPGLLLTGPFINFRFLPRDPSKMP